MQIVPRQVDLLLVRRENVANDQRVELPVAQVIGEIEDDSPVVQPLERLPQAGVQLGIVQLVRRGEDQLRIEPAADRQDRHRSQASICARNSFSSEVGKRRRIKDVDRFVEKRLQLIPQLGVEQELVDFVGGWLSENHWQH